MLGGKRAREGETKNADNSALMVSLLNSALTVPSSCRPQLETVGS